MVSREFEKSATTYHKAIDIGPTTVDFWEQLARCYEALDNRAKTIETYKSAMAAGLRCPSIYAGLGTALHANGAIG